VTFTSFFAGIRHVINLAGLIVTIPHKLPAEHLVDELTPRPAGGRGQRHAARR
jgi:shikimate 5-dehydrogenase